MGLAAETVKAFISNFLSNVYMLVFDSCCNICESIISLSSRGVNPKD